MGMNGVLKAKQILEAGFGVLGIEFVAAAQGLDFRDFQFGNGTKAAHATVRLAVEHLDEDRPLHADHTAMRELVRSEAVLAAVQAVLGKTNLTGGEA